MHPCLPHRQLVLHDKALADLAHELALIRGLRLASGIDGAGERFLLIWDLSKLSLALRV